MRPALHVEHFSLSEYANSDDSGRFILAGMFGETVNFAEHPKLWPNTYMLLILRPYAPEIEFDVVFFDPQGMEFLRFGGSYHNKAQPDHRERLAFVQTFPPLKFAGAGTYAAEVEVFGASIFRKEYAVEIGQAETIEFGEIHFALKTTLDRSSI